MALYNLDCSSMWKGIIHFVRYGDSILNSLLFRLWARLLGGEAAAEGGLESRDEVFFPEGAFGALARFYSRYLGASYGQNQEVLQFIGYLV